jgi:uncharacterized protein involved in response to NO
MSHVDDVAPCRAKGGDEAAPIYGVHAAGNKVMTDLAHSASSLPRRSKASLGAFFSYGFRPFFLGASVFATLIMAVWLTWIATQAAGGSQQWLPVAGSPYAWHAHEMVFGFAVASVAGFLLTAVPNWTGALPLSGSPLVLLFSVWVAGRVVMAFSGHLPAPIVAGVDLAFLPLLGGFAARQLLVRPAARNLVFLLILSVMIAGNAAYHLATAELVSLDPLAAIRPVLMMLVLMLAIIGGRIVPAFTHNWLHVGHPSRARPMRFVRLDLASVGSIALLVLLQIGGAPDVLVGLVALLSGLANGARLLLWRGWAARKAPIVWILHLGYAWVVAGLLITACAALTGRVPIVLAYHAFGTGAVGTMIMAVMTRASLGHTGRPLVAPRLVVWAYWLVTIAAVLRVAGPALVPQHYAAFLTGAGVAWIVAFALFVVVYAPILTTPRVHTRTAA